MRVILVVPHIRFISNLFFLATPISQPQRNFKTAPNQSGKSLASQVAPDMIGNIQPYPLIQRLLRSSKILRNDPVQGGYGNISGEMIGCSAKKMDPTVSIYRRGSELIAVATGVTTMGVGFETGPGVRLSMDLPSDQIGQAITKLFADCGATVEHPKTFGGPDSPILRLSQAASWGEFMKLRPEHLTATLIGHEIVVEHWQRDGRGFSPRSPRDQLSLAFDVPAQVLGDVVLGRSSKPTAKQVADGNPH